MVKRLSTVRKVVTSPNFRVCVVLRYSIISLYPHIQHSVVQRQTALTALFSIKQLLLLTSADFVPAYIRVYSL